MLGGQGDTWTLKGCGALGGATGKEARQILVAKILHLLSRSSVLGAPRYDILELSHFPPQASQTKTSAETLRPR